MEDLTLSGVLAVVLYIASAIVLIANACEKIAKAKKAAKEPNDEQNARLDALEKWKDEVDRKLSSDNDRLGAILNIDRVMLRALQALLDHGIDGNNIKQMQDAKTELQNHLIDNR